MHEKERLNRYLARHGVCSRRAADTLIASGRVKVNEKVVRTLGTIVDGLRDIVLVDGERVLSPGGLRHRDEAVRHKMLDALGDLSLAGAPILGRYTGNRAGHAMTNRLLRALFADPSAFRMSDCADDRRARLPGVGVSRADIPAVA